MQDGQVNIPGPAAAGGSFEWALRVAHNARDESNVFAMRKSEATLGSSHEADIVLDGSDLDDEQYEIRVDLAGRVWLLEFKDQTVRGQLQPNQSWELGEYSITLLSAPRRLSPIERHVPNPEQHNRRPRPQANFPSEPPGYALTVTIRSPDEGEVTTRTFEHVREIDIGRGRERTISLPYRGVGRLHCTLMISERGEVFVRDHYSLNGTLVQKRSVEDIALLLPGEELKISEVIITYDTPPRPLNDAAWKLCHETKDALRNRRYMPTLGSSPDSDASYEITLEVRDKISNSSAELINYDMTFTRDVIKIGRARTNDLVLPAPNVSKHHAILEFDKDGVGTLERLSTVNPVYLSGEEVEGSAEVEPLQVIRIGLYTIRILEVREANRHHQWPNPNQLQDAHATHTIKLSLLKGPTLEKQRGPVELDFSRNIIRIGRALGNHLVLPDRSVSKNHAIIEMQDDDTCMITCLSKVASVYVEGEPIDRTYALEPGQEVTIGPYTLLMRGWEKIPQDD